MFWTCLGSPSHAERMRGRTARFIVVLITVGVAVVAVRGRGLGPMLLAAATVVTLVPTVKRGLKELDRWVPREGVASWRAISQAIAAVVAVAVALGVVAPAVAPTVSTNGRGTPTAAPEPSPIVITVTPTPTISSTPAAPPPTTPPAPVKTVDVELEAGLVRYCDLSREFTAESGKLKGAFASGKIKKSDVQPLINNMSAALDVAPREVRRDLGMLLSDYQAFRDGISDSYWENALLAGGTILSPSAMGTSTRIDEFDQRHCAA